MALTAQAAGLLLRQAHAALQRGDAAGALAVLERADGDSAEVQMTRALALRMAGDLAGAIAALDRVLVRQARNLPALMAKAAVVEQAYGARQAAGVFRQALAVAPDQGVPAGVAAALAHAREVVEADSAALEAWLREHTAPAGLERFDESLAAFAGTGRVPVQRPALLHYTRLPAIPFYDRALFPWLRELEAGSGMIADELRGALAAARDGFVPYIQYPPNVPVNQWGELNHNPAWSSYFLWKDGERQDAACAQCPATAALMERLPLMYQPGFAPTVVFSALQPKTHIPPHTGSANTRLLCHLPLILPGPARFRVGPQLRDWKMGEAWVFDDTIEHEAWNDADEMRVILIIDLWSPFLSDAEKTLIGQMMTARNTYYAG